MFLFVAKAGSARVFKKSYMRGNALEVLASHMSIKNNDTPFLANLYSEICFKTLLFKTAGHDFCPEYDTQVREY